MGRGKQFMFGTLFNPVLVTHDIDEAVRLGDKICLLEGGHVQQYGTPDELLHRPANAFVAAFVGENRELKSLSLRPVSSVMSRTQSSDAAGQVAHDLSAERALALLLGAGGQPLNVTDADGQIIGSLRLQDYGHL
jgi:osmoprotectant transport system ATP-binding protein